MLQKKEEKKAVEKKSEGRKEKRPYDFFPELVGKKVRLHLSDGTMIDCTIVDDSTYQLKIKQNEKVLYINKGLIAFVEPL